MGRFRDFLVELKKRHVYRVAVAYAVVAWIVVQAASIVVPELLLPSWITRAVIVLALLGFPLAVVLAWAYDITADGVQRTPRREPGRSSDGPRRAAPRTPDTFRTVRWFAVAGVTLLVAGGAAWVAFGRATDEVPRGEQLHDELAELTQQYRYAEAFALAQRAAGAGEAVSDSLAALFTDRLTVMSEPAGAQVRALRFGSDVDPATGSWIELGSTPVRGAPLARGDYIVRIEHADHATAERMVSSAALRAILTPQLGAEVQVDVRLARAEYVPDGMVYVPGGSYRVASRDLQSLSATIDDYLIDRFEVTNARFAEFVDAGGYERAEYWADMQGVADAAALRRGFRDRTGLPGPREWRGQQPAPEVREHPVTGVTWYEAVAYCRFRRSRLPTLFEWEKAARDGEAARGPGIMMPWGYVGAREPPIDRANLDGASTMPVASFPFGVSPYGAHDMAGNAKEWLHNRSESGRAVTGGSYADPIYVFSEVGSMDPAAASPTVGFRCARTAEPPGVQHGSGDAPLRLAITTPVYRPVDEATFRVLLSHYDYDARALDARVEERFEAPAWTRERITYAGPAGDRVIAFLFLPRTGSPPFQTIVYVPNSAVFFGTSVDVQAAEMLGALVRDGRALFSVVMHGMTGREFPGDWQPPPTRSVAFRDLMVQHATELRLGLDYLETRDEIDRTGLVYAGSSWGSGSRLAFAAIDPRFRAAILIGAGIDERLHPTLPEASNINFAPYIRGPKVVVNGREDEEHPWLTRALPLWNLLSEPKELALFDGVGHLPPLELRIPAIREFLDRVVK
jgi:formylglycine-generating enzyme required for sulfatase activity